LLSLTLFSDIENAAYTAVSAVASAFSGAGGAGVAIAVCTVAVRLLLLPLTLRAVRGERRRARLGPQITALRRKYSADPGRLARETIELYRANQVSPFAGVLPSLLQVPVFTVLYRLFYAARIAGHPNALLGQTLFGVPLGARFLVGAGGGTGGMLVFAGVFAALALAGWWGAWWARRVARANGAAMVGVAGWVARLSPFASVLAVAFVPLAAGVYLVTTRAFSAVETTLLRRGLPPTPP
jgi:YidC/Oxa1 family membrane protein insertase